LLALLVHSWFDLNLHIPANAILATTLLALVSGHFRFATERHWHTVRWLLRVPVLLALAAAFACLGAQAWRRTAQTYWLNRAHRQPAGSPDQLTALEYAFAAEPRDFETAYQIGEAYRWRSWEGGDNYRTLASKALDWFQRAKELNPYYAYAFMRYGMCLHWLGRHDEAASSFQRALQLDPNGYYTVAHQGWHCVQLGDWEQARQWFEKSLALKPADNPIASSYLDIANRRLQEAQPAAPKGEEKK
jgi:tetratricopeptide (TPR) repeat protein